LGGNEDALDPARGITQLGYADVGVTFSPFYGKMALAAEQVLHFDGFISAGLGAVFDTTPNEPFHPAVEVGVGARVFLTRWLTIRADVRNYTYPQTVANELTFPSSLILTLGAGIHIPFDFDYSTEIIGGKA
jgi:outer membrane beta-barrel protein